MCIFKGMFNTNFTNEDELSLIKTAINTHVFPSRHCCEGRSFNWRKYVGRGRAKGYLCLFDMPIGKAQVASLEPALHTCASLYIFRRIDNEQY